ncbi:MAG: bifunctional methylenetetrahydrofolate dehydrogenase/methenyltetrahydrofolate cyclohydrolase, partial [Chloroflexota bacterium]
MTTQIIDGNAVAARIREEVRQGVEALKRDYGIVPGL